MKKYRLYILVLLGFYIIGMQGCRKKNCPCDDPSNPLCENYDPTHGLPSADFTMRQSLRPFGWSDKPENIAEYADTIVVSQSGVLFTAKEHDAIRYEWTIGDDQRKFNTREVALRFDQYLQDPSNQNKKIPVQLKVVKKPPPPFSIKDSVYISKRFLMFRPVFLWNGTFKGRFHHEPGKERTISFDYTNTVKWKVPPKTFADCPDSCEIEAVVLKGFPQGEELKVAFHHVIEESYPNFYSYKQRKWRANESDRKYNISFMVISSGITYFHAFADYLEDGRIRIQLEYKHQKELNGKEKTYRFTGYKID